MFKLCGILFLLRALSGYAPEDPRIDAMLEQTVNRQEQALQAQLVLTFPASGLWRHENFALAAYWLNTSNTVADAGLINSVTNGLYQAEINAEKFHWHAYLQERIYFLFSSRSAHFPGRMSIHAENAVLEMLWNWASPRCTREMARTDRVWWSWGTENHHSQMWGSFWGAAHIFKDHPDYQNRTYADGTSPAEMAAAFDAYFKAYARERSLKGITVETASAYAKYTLGPWYNIADFAEDEELAELMSQLLDLYWADWAIEQINGVRGGSRHRCYPGGGSISESGADTLTWFHFGLGAKIANKHPSSMCSATTFWRPSRVVAGLALDTDGRGEYVYISRRPGLKEFPDGPDFIQDPDHPMHKIFLLNPDGGSLLRYSWCTPDFIMGMSQVASLTRDHWVNFSSQNRWNGVIFAGHPTARIFTQPYKPAAGSVYNAEWGVQNKGAMVLQRLRSSNANGQMIWFDFSLNRVETEGWIFAEAPQAYAAVKIVEGEWSWQPDEPGQNRGEWAVLTNEYSPVIIEVGRKKEYDDFTAFRNGILSNDLMYTTSGTGRLDYNSSFYNTTLTLFAQTNFLPLVDGEELQLDPERCYISPYIQGGFRDDEVVIQYGGKERRFSMPLPAVDF